MGYLMKNNVPYAAGITPITITGTLTAGSTSVVFTNAAILEGERYNFYAWNRPDLKPTNAVISGNTLTLTYPAQTADVNIKVVINENVNTTSNDETKADKTDLTSILASGATNTTGATITAGTYFYLDNVLVRAKANIATNATFTLNTNYEVVSAGALNELVADLETKVSIKSGSDKIKVMYKEHTFTTAITLAPFTSGAVFTNPTGGTIVGGVCNGKGYCVSFAFTYGGSVYMYNATNTSVTYPVGTKIDFVLFYI